MIIPRILESVIERSMSDTINIITILLQMKDQNNLNMASLQNNQGYFPLFIALQKGYLGRERASPNTST